MLPSFFRWIAALATLNMFLGLPMAAAENPAGGLPPQLAPLAAKYQTDLKALTEARGKAVGQLRQPYLTALAAAEQKATNEGKLDELKVVTEEKDVVSGGRALPAVASPLLPRALAPPRALLLRETARADREYAVHAQEAAAEYLRGLVFYENKARAAGQTDLLKLIEAEKLKLAGQNAVGARPTRAVAVNLVTNGDFAQKKDDGNPESWGPGAPRTGAVTMEQGTTFLRMVSVNKSEAYFLENVERPADVQELAVSVRLRCRDMKGQGTYGVVVAQRDGENKLVARDLPCDLTAPSPGWRSLSGLVKIHPETKTLIIRCHIIDCLATVDFADVRVEGR